MKQILNYIDKSFNVPPRDLKMIIREFHSQMHKGLSGKTSSLKMLPAYVDRPSGREKGRFIALDLGGTNLRVLELELKGKGQIRLIAERKFVLQKTHISTNAESLFDFIAGSVKNFIRAQKIGDDKKIALGFTFSFPMKQTGVASGKLIHWTKGFSAKGVVGKDIVKLLKYSLLKKGLVNIRVAALTNDTVGTLVARAYKDQACDIGVILGTGTNACYRERVAQIRKFKDKRAHATHMLVNIEWGGFNKLERLPYDLELDALSTNPGEQVLEKMVSGMYLGEIARIILKDLIKRKILFAAGGCFSFNAKDNFKTEYMSEIEGDRSKGLRGVARALKRLGVSRATLEDKILVRKICKVVSMRAARVSAGSLAAVVTKMDPHLLRKHTVAIDGTVYEKYPGFARNIRVALRELFGRKNSRIRITLTKDGSGRGAAIIAAVATK
ncbi:MAG: hexokinase [Candidatus Omnitrophica bacterium]|nr:hexokinase [Candidatus Omnitrophota bacterium]